MTTDATPVTGTSTAVPASATTPVATQVDPAQSTTAPTIAPVTADVTTAVPAPATDPASPAAEGADPAKPAAADPAAPKDWAARRAEYANGDEKLLKRLSRYSSERDAIEALISAQNKIASGALKNALPRDATPEQLAEWRAENGIPEKPEEYDVTLPNGMVIGEADKPVVDRFLKTAHENNMTPAQVKANLAWYYADQERAVTEMHQNDEAIASKAEEILRGEWGSEYKLNLNLVQAMLDNAPSGLKEQLLGARLADGTPFGSNPENLRWLANLAREINPTATVVPGSGANALQAIESELASMNKMMGDRTSAYWKGPDAEKMQARYRELVSVKQKVS